MVQAIQRLFGARKMNKQLDAMVRVRVNKKVFDDAQKIFKANGLTLSSVLRMYLTKIANGEIEIKLQQVYKK
jgi:antitoxin component of RelBE/YafQ-DinJ toxin-antitoxin module